MAPTETISINAVLDHMARNKATTVATIGITTSYGKGFSKALDRLAPPKGVKIVAVEKYPRTDQSTTAQVLKVMAANPDAVYIFSAGTPGALPHIELVKRGYKGLIYQTQGVANADFLRVGGKDLEGSFMTVAPVLVAEQLPDSNPVKKIGVDCVKLRDAIEGLKEFVGAQGVFNLSDKDHNGVDARGQVMVRVEGGQWKLVN